MLLWVCYVIDHRGDQNAVRNICDTSASPSFCVLPTFYVICSAYNIYPIVLIFLIIVERFDCRFSSISLTDNIVSIE